MVVAAQRLGAWQQWCCTQSILAEDTQRSAYMPFPACAAKAAASLRLATMCSHSCTAAERLMAAVHLLTTGSLLVWTHRYPSYITVTQLRLGLAELLHDCSQHKVSAAVSGDPYHRRRGRLCMLTGALRLC